MRELSPGASVHYQDAGRYDVRYQARKEDVAFYCEETRRLPRILQWGAGTGRITLPLLEAGHDVCAVDSSAEMLRALKKKGAAAGFLPGALRAEKGDMRSTQPQGEFDAVVAGFSTFSHLYSHEDIAACLRASHRALRSGGALLFDLPAPLLTSPDYDPISQTMLVEFEPSSVGQADFITQRIFFPQEIRLHLAAAGFQEIAFGGDFQWDLPLNEASVWVVKAIAR